MRRIVLQHIGIKAATYKAAIYRGRHRIKGQARRATRFHFAPCRSRLTAADPPPIRGGVSFDLLGRHHRFHELLTARHCNRPAGATITDSHIGDPNAAPEVSHTNMYLTEGALCETNVDKLVTDDR